MKQRASPSFLISERYDGRCTLLLLLHCGSPVNWVGALTWMAIYQFRKNVGGAEVSSEVALQSYSKNQLPLRGTLQ